MGKILAPFSLPHFCICGTISVGFEPILKTTRRHASFAHSGKVSHGASEGLVVEAIVSGRFLALPFPGSLWLVKEGCVSCVLAAVMSPAPKDSCFTSP
jgi:hypothetical protein